MNEEQKIAAVKTSAVSLAALAGLTLNDIVAIMSILFIGLQIGLLIPKYWRLFSSWFKGRP